MSRVILVAAKHFWLSNDQAEHDKTPLLKLEIYQFIHENKNTIKLDLCFYSY